MFFNRWICTSRLAGGRAIILNLKFFKVKGPRVIILLKFSYKVDDNAFRASFGLNYKKCSSSSQKSPLRLKTILYVVKFKENNLENLQQRS